MPRRRGKGEGSIRQRADGRWEVRIDLGRGLNGKRRQKSVFAESESIAIAELKRLHARMVGGQVLVSSTPTVASYLEDWFASNSDTWRPSTRRSYRGAIDLYLAPAFGKIRLEKLTPLIVQRWLNRHKEEHGARRRISLAHATLRSALSDAQRLQLISVNAAALLRVPKPAKRAITPLTMEQAAAFLKVADGHPLRALFSVALACGLRLGEATGLRWSDVNLDTGELEIRQQIQRVNKRLVLQDLKTAKSRRSLLLPQKCMTALRAHRTQQLERRLKAGPDWIDSGLVFATLRRNKEGKIGGPIDPRNVLRILYRLCGAAEPKIPRRRFHDLRHSAASLLIAAGVELVEVSMLLGHSELRVTADLYSHLQKQTAAKAARHMDAIFG